MKNFRLQSAMEYLMTYGWAILIIAVVLVALFSLGLFGSPIGTTCLPQSGFECTNPSLSSASGNLIVTVGQIGQSWTSSNIVFVPQGTTVSSLAGVAGTPYFIGSTSTPKGDANVVAGGLVSGSPVTATIPVIPPGSPIGTSLTGQLWVQYTTPSSSAPLYDEIATVTLKSS